MGMGAGRDAGVSVVVGAAAAAVVVDGGDGVVGGCAEASSSCGFGGAPKDDVSVQSSATLLAEPRL